MTEADDFPPLKAGVVRVLAILQMTSLQWRQQWNSMVW